MTFHGQVTGHPPPTCEWVFNGVSLGLPSTELLSHTGVRRIRTLPVVESGVYQFIATNRLGSDERTIRVTLPGDSDNENEDDSNSRTNSPPIGGEKSDSMSREKPVPVAQLKDYVVLLQSNNNDGFHCQYKVGF